MSDTTSHQSGVLAPSLWRRMACWLYEGILLFGVVFVAGQVFSIATRMDHALRGRGLLQIFMFMVLGLYFVWFWSHGRQTLAMKTWHIRLVDRAGQPISQIRALWRYILCWLWFVPPLGVLAAVHNWQQHTGLTTLAVLLWVMFWALLTRIMPGQQFLHDVLAGTRLVHHQRSSIPHRKWWQL